jgi:hypothetical protein
VETAVMIRGRTQRKTMKRPRLDPLSLLQVSKPPGKQWSSTTHAPPRWRARRRIGESINDTPMLETLQPHRLPVPWQTAICLVTCLRDRGERGEVRGAGCGNSGDDPRADTPQNDEKPPSRSIVSHPRETKRTPAKQWSAMVSNHPPPTQIVPKSPLTPPYPCDILPVV